MKSFEWFVFAATAQARLWSMKSCTPAMGSPSCPPNPGFGENVTFDFSGTSQKEDIEKFWTLDPRSQEDWLTIDLRTEDKGAALKVLEPLHGPTLASKKYLMFGKVFLELQAAPGKGVVTAIVLKSDTGNKIDWEILGAYDKQVQSNYFFDGRPIYNQFADTYNLDFSTTSDFHTYTIEWSDKFLIFSVDGKELKTWRYGDIPGEQWPQLPMQVKVGVWAVTEDSEPGEIEWAGGVPDWEIDAPFMAYYRTLKVQDAAAFCHGKTGDISYVWNEGAQWEDIRVMGCERRGSGGLMPDNVVTAGTEIPTVSSAAAEASDTCADPEPSTTEQTESSDTTTETRSESTSTTAGSEEDVAVSVEAPGLLMAVVPLVWNLAV